MSKILSFKSSLRFSSWVVLASFLSVPLSHAMDNEEENKKLCPPLPLNVVQYIASFVTDPKDLESMTLVNKVWNRGVKKKSQKVYESIQEKMKELDGSGQELIRNVFGKEVDCDKHTHFNVLKFVDCFKEDPKKYKTLYQQLLKFPNLSKFHKRTMMLNAAEFGLLKHFGLELIQVYETFSVEQMEILGKYGEFLIPDRMFSSEYQKLLEAFKLFRIEQFEALGRNAASIFQNVEGRYRIEFMKPLSSFSIEQMDILGKYGEFLIPKMTFSPDYQELLEAFKLLLIEQFDALGRNAASIFQNVEGRDCRKLIEPLSTFSVEQIDALGRNAQSIFQNVEGRDCIRFLKPLSAFSIEQFDALGRNAAAIFQNAGSRECVEFMKPLSAYSVEQFDALGRNAAAIFQNVKNGDYIEFMEPLSTFSVEQIDAIGRNSVSIFENMKDYCGDCNFMIILASYSVEQMDILGKYGEFLIPDRMFSSEYQKLLEAFKLFRIEQFEALGRNAESIFQNVEGRYRIEFMKPLSSFSIEQMDILGKHGESLLPKMDSPYYKEYLNALQLFRIKQFDALGRNAAAIFKNIENRNRKSILGPLSTLSAEQIDALGRNAETIFQNVEGRRYAEFIKKNLKDLTPKQIEIFAQEKEKKINEKNNENK